MPAPAKIMRLSKDFTNAEFACRCDYADCNAPMVDFELVQKLQQLRDIWGKPITITSGSRCSRMNTLAGGSPHSQHLLGRAVDLYLADRFEIEAVARLAEELGFGGIGRGVISLCHLDVGGMGRRWAYQTK